MKCKIHTSHSMCIKKSAGRCYTISLALQRQSNLHRILNNALCTDGMPVYRQTHTKHTESLAILSSITHDVSGSNDSASLG